MIYAAPALRYGTYCSEFTVTMQYVKMMKRDEKSWMEEIMIYFT